jgi:hypothetical protein
VEALQLFVSLSAFRAFSTSLQNETLAFSLMPSPPSPLSSEKAERAQNLRDTKGFGVRGVIEMSPSPSTSRPASPFVGLKETEESKVCKSKTS